MSPSTLLSAPAVRVDLARLPEGAVVVHGGQHKTGTSALQNALWASPDALREAGWTYPRSGTVGQAATGLRHRPLMTELRDGADPTSWAALRAELQGVPGRVVLSHENFLSPQVDPRRLAAQLPGRRVVLLAYVRHPVDYLDSCYREWVRRMGYAQDVAAFHARRLGYLDLPRLVADWESVFGPDSVVLRPYERRALVGGSTVSDAMALLGVAGAQDVALPANDSLTTRQVLVHLVGNGLGLHVQAEMRLLLARLLQDDDSRAEALAALPDRPGDGWSARRLDALREVLGARLPVPSRLVDDALVEELERDWLPGAQRLLREHGADEQVLTRSVVAARPFDACLSDRRLVGAVRDVLA